MQKNSSPVKNVALLTIDLSKFNLKKEGMTFGIGVVALFAIAALKAHYREPVPPTPFEARQNRIVACSGYQTGLGKAEGTVLTTHRDPKNNFYIDGQKIIDRQLQKKGKPVIHLRTTIHYIEPYAGIGPEMKFVETGNLIFGEGKASNIVVYLPRVAGEVEPRLYEKDDRKIFHRLEGCVAKYPERPDERPPAPSTSPVSPK